MSGARVCLDPGTQNCDTFSATTNIVGEYSISNVQPGGFGHNVYLTPESLPSGATITSANPILSNICANDVKNFTIAIPATLTPTAAPRPTSSGGGGGGGGAPAPFVPTSTPVPTETATPTPSGHILREIIIENRDTDGSIGGSIPLRITTNFQDYLAKPISWRLNNLPEGQNEAIRTVQITFSDGTTFIPYTAAVTLIRPTEKTGVLASVEVSFDCKNLDNILVGTECHASALAYDGAMVPIFGNNVTYEWGISSSNSIGKLDPLIDTTTTFSAKNIGGGEIWVIAKQKDRSAQKSSTVITTAALTPTTGAGRFIPTPTPLPTPTPTLTPTIPPPTPTALPTPIPTEETGFLYRLSFDPNFSTVIEQGSFGNVNERIINLTLPGQSGTKTVYIQFFENGAWGPVPAQAVTILLR